MKKLIFTLAAAAALTLGACSGAASANPDDIAQKIKNDEPLTQAEYSVMLDYIGDMIKEGSELMSDDKSDDIEASMEQYDKINKKYPHALVFIEKLNYTTDLNADNLEKAQKLNRDALEMW
ncbi:MAG: hypothetical protein NC418_01775 [Muribaculaceae bacterium]|nr:hypothetical protein [Muribaculaceae bacterium]